MTTTHDSAAAGPSVTDWMIGWGGVIGAGAAALTFVVAVVAAVYAYKQWVVARQAREDALTAEVERSQPYVSVYLDTAAGWAQNVELIVQNFDPTAARNIVVDFGGVLHRSGDQDAWSEFAVPLIPYLAPGQQWKTWFDSGASRSKSDLPSQYQGRVTYTGLNGQERSEDLSLDFGPSETRLQLNEPTLEDLIKAVRAVANKK
jgi:hypothetical protein